MKSTLGKTLAFDSYGAEGSFTDQNPGSARMHRQNDLLGHHHPLEAYLSNPATKWASS